jgi:hypothetical protein
LSDAVEQEIGAIRSVLAALVPLPAEARVHVIDYVLKRLAITAPISTADLPVASVSTGVDVSPVSSVPHGRHASTVHIKQLKIEKRPRSSNEMAALVAYYLANMAPEHEQKRTVNTRDVETYFKIYPAHAIIRNFLGSMTRKLSVTSSQ